MENSLELQYVCLPEKCPVAEKCTVGPMPNSPCPVKTGFMDYISESLAMTFKDIDERPEVSIRVNLLIKPLFEMLLKLRMAEHGTNSVYFGGKMNPVYKEIRSTMAAINIVLKDTQDIYNPDSNKPGPKQLRNAIGGNYYEMLLGDGVTSVEERIGVS